MRADHQQPCLNPNDLRNRPQPKQFETMNSGTDKSSKPGGGWTPRAAGRIVLIYAVFAGLWILLSDGVLVWLVNDPSQIGFFSTVKGWLFVGVTSLLLFGLIQRLLNHVLSLSRREHEAQAESNKKPPKKINPNRKEISFFILTSRIHSQGFEDISY